MRSEHESNGSWDHWVSRSIGGLERGQKNLHHRVTETRRAAFQDLMLVRREMLGAIAPLVAKRRKTEWVRHVPWVKLTILFMMAILLLTGHITASELKTWLLKRIQEF
jgi:hypothetical protein